MVVCDLLELQTQNYVFWVVVTGSAVAGLNPQPIARNYHSEPVVLSLPLCFCDGG